MTSGTWQTSSLITGNNVSLNSREGDIRIAGSAIDAINNVGLTARQGSVVIDTGSATREHSSSYSNKSVGDLGREGSGFTVGVRSSSGSLDERSSTPSAAGSTITSRQGDVSIIAQDDLLIRGSDIRAGRDMLLGGQTVTIDGSYDTSVYRRFQETSQIGVTVSASNPVVSAVQSTNRMREAAQESNNGRLQAIAAVAAGLAAKNAYDAVAKDPARAGGISINVDLGASSASQTSTGQSSTASGAAIAAGRDLTIIAAGKGEQSDIIVAGSDLAAGRNVLLDAQGDLLLIAQQNTSSQKTDGKSSNASIGVGFSLGGSQQGFSINLGAGGSKSKSDGQASTWNNTHVQAGNTLTMNSGGDTVLRGAQASGDRILATVGGNLLVESLQDINSFTARDRSVGVQVSLCIPPICYGASSVSGNYGKTNIDSKYASVTEQTGLWAGDGGFQLDVAKNTGLIGGVIASSDKAVADARNVLITGTLTSRDIENHARYEGQSLQLGGGVSFGGGKEDGKDKNNVGTDGKGEAAGGSKATPNSNLPAINGVSAVPPVPMGANGESSSTTLSGISGGKIVIRDEIGQKAQTGQTAEEAIASLNRDTKDTLNSLDPIFDEKEVRAGFEIVGETGRQVGQFLANRAEELKDAKARSEDASLSDVERLQATKEYYDLQSKWGTSGTYRHLSTAVLAAAAGNVTGATNQFVQAAAVNYLQGLGAAQIKELSKGLGGDGSAGNAALHTILGCAGAAAQNASCAAGGVGALSSVVLNKLLDSTREDATKQLSPEERQARINLLDSIVAGIAAAIDPSVAAAAQTGARIEAENNYLSEKQNAQKNEEIQACTSWACAAKVKVKWAAIDAGQDVSFYSGVMAGVPAGLYDLAQGIVDTAASPLETYAALKSLLESDDVPGTVSAAMKQSLIERITRMEEEYQRAGAAGSFNAGLEGGKLIFDVALLVGGGASLVKAGASLTKKVTAQIARNAAKVEVGRAGKGIGEISNLGRVESTYSAINPGPLAENIAETFSGGKYSVIKLEKDTVLYRAGTSDKPLGQFFSSEPPAGVVQTRIDKAVLPEWPGGAKSVIDTSFEIKIPAGTKVYVGEVGSQGGFYVGGTQQIVVQKPWLIDGIEIIKSSPLK